MRGEKCNPTNRYICWVVSPLSSLIWGIRQRSLKLAIFPYLFVFVAGYIILSFARVNPLKLEIKIPLQLIGGYYSFDFTKKLIDAPLKRKKKTLDNEITN